MSTTTAANTPVATPAAAAKARRHTIIDVPAPGVTSPATPKEVTAKATVATPVVKAAPVIAPIAPKPSPGVKRLDLLAFEEGIQTIPLKDLIVPRDGNTTRPEGVGEIEDLQGQIEAFGQLVPVIVQRMENGLTLLVAGFRRAAALKALGQTTVKVRFLRDTSVRARILANVTENEDSKKKITALGRLAAIQALQREGFTIAQLATAMGQVEDYVRDTLRIPQGAPCIAKALAIPDGKPGSMSFSGAKFILRVGESGRALPVGARVTPEDIKAQEKLFAKCLGLNTLAVRAEVEAFKNPEKATKKPDAKGEGAADSDAEEGVTLKIVTALVVPPLARYEDSIKETDAAVKALHTALEALGLGEALKGAGVTAALKALDSAQAIAVKAWNAQSEKAAKVIGEKAFKAALKDAHS